DAGAVDVHQVEAGVVADQLVDPGLEHVHAQAPALALAVHAEVGAARLLWLEVGVVEAGVVQVVEGRCLETGPGAGAQPPGFTQGQAVAEAAGGAVAELGVVVVARAGLQRMRAEAALVLDEGAEVVAAAALEAGAAGNAVVLPVQSGAEQLPRAEAGVQLQRGQVAAGTVAVDQAARAVLAVIALGVVAGAAGLGLQRDALAQA